jgi:hypothetical protein
VVGVAADFVRIVAVSDQQLGGLGEAVGGGQMEACVGFVVEGGVLKDTGVVVDDTFD